MKTKEELNALKEEVINLNEKLRELTEDELKEVGGGIMPWIVACPNQMDEMIISGMGNDTGKDHYENIILRTCPEEHNVMNINNPSLSGDKLNRTGIK